MNSNDFLIKAENEYSEYRKKVMNKFSLNAAETDILMFLANNPAYDTATQISKIRMIPKSQVSVAVRSLCEKGFLEAFYKQGNKKSQHLLLSGRAEAIVNYGREIQKDFAEMLFCGFSKKEKSEFTRLHLKIAENIEKHKENDK